ncbi:hypothetical protein LJ737_07475 [Hymenobacter sp. 15J16-1T3B]|uniref:hypothetical protein n=1 Tax=Hymenobacter sp. 15J16-1T3B TaxID=2886941 RepID=UPI001D1239F9|nr:hypothetical protein [Hymenobacter sp. 15J16-1T3B]MCC3157073.1 hypothetical protein [Hymenobacter sp. 15J16-1T3B]
MSNSLPRLLVRLVAKPFYREHTGLLFGLFVFLFSSFFYTNVLNQTHLTPAQILATALRLARASVSHPLGTAALLGVFLFYSLKTWQYAARRLREPEVHFLRYSTTALPAARQLRAWAVVQVVTSLPIIVLGTYAGLVGVRYGYWLVPLLIPGILAGLIGGGAGYCVRLLNRPIDEPSAAARTGWLRRWPKPLFSLFLYELLIRRRVALGVTKLLSLLSLTLILRVFPDGHTNLRLVGLLGLWAALVHAVLLYQSHEFEDTYLRFARNFPYHSGQVLGQQAALYGLLLAPELIWLAVAVPPGPALVGGLLLLSTTLLFRALLYRVGLRMKTYLRLLFGLFLLLLLADMFNLTLLLVVGGGLSAWGLLHRRSFAD